MRRAMNLSFFGGSRSGYFVISVPTIESTTRSLAVLTMAMTE